MSRRCPACEAGYEYCYAAGASRPILVLCRFCKGTQIACESGDHDEKSGKVQQKADLDEKVVLESNEPESPQGSRCDGQPLRRTTGKKYRSANRREKRE
jgi:hypothetical protein